MARPQIDLLVPKQAPTLLDAEKGNELITYVNGLLESEGIGALQLSVADSGKLTLSFSSKSPLGNIEDYEEIDVVLCRNGIPVRGKMLFAEVEFDTPEDE